MASDEEQFRALVRTWPSATQAGDIDTVPRRVGRRLLARDATLLSVVEGASK